VVARTGAEVVAHLSWTAPTHVPCTDCCEALVSKKTKMRKLKARRKKANHGRKPNAGR
jgi:hypothetical protein